MALWVGLCLYLSLLVRQPRSYGFMLSGYTVALIGFPTVSDPGSIFDVALARVEEITLGILCATLVSTVLLPRGVAPAVAGRVESWLKDARRLTRDVLLGHGNEHEPARGGSSFPPTRSKSTHLRVICPTTRWPMPTRFEACNWSGGT